MGNNRKKQQHMITRNESMMAALLTAAIDDGFRLAVKDNKLYLVDILNDDLGGYPLCFPIKFTGNDFADLDVVRVPDGSTEPPFRTMYEVAHGEPPKPVMIKGTPVSATEEEEDEDDLFPLGVL